MAVRKRGKQVAFRMTDEEFEILMKKIEKSGMSQQQYMIRCALDKPIANTDGLREVIPEIKRIGINMNQIAKTLNQGEKDKAREMIFEIGQEMKEPWQLLKQLAQKLQ